jgi:competence ComEA-like helix-hairpin-helix protein
VVLVLPLSCAFVLVPSAFTATKKPPSHPIDINSASAVQLQEVPGIGPATAEKILQMRKSYGAFKSVDDLLSVRGIGAKRLEKMRKFLVAGHAAPGRRAGGSATAAKPVTRGGCARAATGGASVKKAAAAPRTAAKPVVESGEAADSDEEPE